MRTSGKEIERVGETVLSRTASSRCQASRVGGGRSSEMAGQTTDANTWG